jgi:hypothetical protein
MAAVVTSRKSVSFLYDFAVNGGAVGSINMGVFIPANAVIYGGYILCQTALTSGGSATISVGYSSAATILASNIAYTTFNSGGVVSIGVDLSANPKFLDTARQLTITIGTAALTAGSLTYFCEYTEWPLTPTVL